MKDIGTEAALREMLEIICLKQEKRKMDEIWVVESGDLDNLHVFGVYSSMNGAISDIKSFYGPPYLVDWLEPKAIWQGFVLTGRFDAVHGFSAKHNYDLTLRKWILDESWQDRKARYAND